MSESKADEQYLANSDLASRERMTGAEWLKETIQDGHLLEDIDPVEFTNDMIEMFKFNHHEMAECGYRLTRYIMSIAERVNRERMEQFERDLEEEK